MTGGAICLLGFAFFSLSRKLSSMRSITTPEGLSKLQDDLESWQKRTELELDSQFERIRSSLGRLDREKRKRADPAGAAGEVAQEDSVDEQGSLNRALAAKLFSRTG